MSLTAAGLAALERLFNRYLALSPGVSERMARLHGRVFRFQLEGLGVSLHMVPGPDGVSLLQSIEGEPDCTLRGTPLALLHLGDEKRGPDSLFAGEVTISGDTELAHRLGDVLAGMDVDWEEELSRYTGDVVAHQVGRGVRGGLHWGARTLETLGLDLTEYLREELALLPERDEVDGFLRDVDELRDDVERLEARLRLLTGTPGESGSGGPDE